MNVATTAHMLRSKAFIASPDPLLNCLRNEKVQVGNQSGVTENKMVARVFAENACQAQHGRVWGDTPVWWCDLGSHPGGKNKDAARVGHPAFHPGSQKQGGTQSCG